MADPTTNSWTKLSIWPGDGASPEDFTAKVCGLTTKEFTISATTSDTDVPDCDDPDAPSWTQRVVRSLSSGLNGAGIMVEEVLPFYRDWMISGEAKNVRIVLTGQTVTGYFEGRYLLTNFGLPANLNDGKIGLSLQFASDGPIAWVNGAP
jgi:hypothetical protein